MECDSCWVPYEHNGPERALLTRYLSNTVQHVPIQMILKVISKNYRSNIISTQPNIQIRWNATESRIKGMIHYPVRKPGIKNPLGQKKKRERTPRSNAVYRAPRIRVLD